MSSFNKIETFFYINDRFRLLEMLQVKLVSAVQIPSMNTKGVYTLYSPIQFTLKPNERKAVETGIIIATPDEFHPMIMSAEIFASHGIEVIYNSLLNINIDINDELVIHIRNSGLCSYKVSIGDPIAKLIILRNKCLPIDQVTVIINQNSYTSNHANILKNNEVKRIAQTPNIWFKRRYINDASSCDKYINDAVNDLLDEFHKTSEYDMMSDKPMANANFIWKNISLSTRTQIIIDYNIAKKQILESDTPDYDSNLLDIDLFNNTEDKKFQEKISNLSLTDSDNESNTSESDSGNDNKSSKNKSSKNKFVKSNKSSKLSKNKSEKIVNSKNEVSD